MVRFILGRLGFSGLFRDRSVHSRGVGGLVVHSGGAYR